MTAAITRLALLIIKRWPPIALITSAALLVIVHAVQTFGHLPPCHLCLKQREVYWAAMGISAGAVALGFMPTRLPWRRIAGALLTVTFAYGAYLAAFHAGAEWKWWPAPSTCASTGPVSMSDLTALMAGAAAKGPACDVAPWRLFGLSMAGWNFLISLKLMVWSALSAWVKEKP